MNYLDRINKPNRSGIAESKGDIYQISSILRNNGINPIRANNQYGYEINERGRKWLDDMIYGLARPEHRFGYIASLSYVLREMANGKV